MVRVISGKLEFLSIRFCDSVGSRTVSCFDEFTCHETAGFRRQEQL